jgi:hypothetical protein
VVHAAREFIDFGAYASRTAQILTIIRLLIAFDSSVHYDVYIYIYYNIMVRLVFYFLVCIVSVVIDFRGRSVIA